MNSVLLTETNPVYNCEDNFDLVNIYRNADGTENLARIKRSMVVGKVWGQWLLVPRLAIKPNAINFFQKIKSFWTITEADFKNVYLTFIPVGFLITNTVIESK